ncbi:hypothetical protein FA95DRAFT_997121 [Auriscalpium vulgare]|uniref:Uncharacterized protein n=1 Tax=Auriscalpium vulgare TaxID=40419 RepID=A0ACB8RY18_9AGAM|nr:hypothetical protein FA95DRAFT_997121 [Auriscalpium vulgare]
MAPHPHFERPLLPQTKHARGGVRVSIHASRYHCLRLPRLMAARLQQRPTRTSRRMAAAFPQPSARAARSLSFARSSVSMLVLFRRLPGSSVDVPEMRKKTTFRSQRRPSSAGDNEALFAEGVVDEKDERASSQSIGWEDAGSDKENALASAPPPRNEGNPFDLIDSINRGILQPLSRTSSPDGGDDPFGLLAAERRIKERRLQAAREAVDELPTAGPSRLPAADDRRPFGPRTFADLDEPSPAPLSQQLPFPSSPAHPALGSRLPPSSPEIPRYSDSDVEDLYATPPAAPLPLTPRKRQQAETPRHSDNAREDVTMRKRRRRGADMSIEDFAERGSSAVSSPSPVKRTSTWDMGREEWENRPTKRLRAPGGGKENATAAAVVESSRMAAQADDATPRKRPRRSARERPGPAPDAESESDGHEHGKGKAKAPRGRSVTRGRGRGRGRGKGKGRSADASASRTRKKKDESTPDDIREKRERERQERVEYFKKLDGYTLPKENVYVI